MLTRGKTLPLGGATVATLLAAVSAPGVASAAEAGATIAPDLISVADVTATDEDYNGSGANDTTAVFTFDQPVAVADQNRFQLVPVEQPGEPLQSIRVLQGEGTTELLVAFEGRLSATETARGTVDRNTVRDADGGDETLNPPQTAPVSNGGNSTAPDLVSVNRDGDTLLFTFDQPTNEDDDVIQNTAGLRFYREDTSVVESQAVERVDEDTLRAFYEDGVDVGTAVGGFVPQGTVVGEDANGDGSFDPNALDEVILGAPVDATVCPSAETDTTALPASWTVAPDLVFVGNFREGPFIGTTPTTCVDFVFAEDEVYLGGGDRTNFHLVPVDAGEVLDGTAREPESDEEGDDTITVIFEGDLDRDDFARGFVDGEVVTENANGDGPYNVTHADAIENGGGGSTMAPDLETVSVRSDNQLYFEFDEALDQEDVIQDTAGLRMYTEDGRVFSAARVLPTNRDDVLVAKFDLPEDVSARDAVGGIVTQGTVAAPDQDGDGTKEYNDVDEVRLSAGNIQTDTVEIID